jgi:hypothetical protein
LTDLSVSEEVEAGVVDEVVEQERAVEGINPKNEIQSSKVEISSFSNDLSRHQYLRPRLRYLLHLQLRLGSPRFLLENRMSLPLPKVINLLQRLLSLVRSSNDPLENTFRPRLQSLHLSNLRWHLYSPDPHLRTPAAGEEEGAVREVSSIRMWLYRIDLALHLHLQP